MIYMYSINNNKSRDPFSTTLRESNPEKHITIYIITISVQVVVADTDTTPSILLPWTRLFE